MSIQMGSSLFLQVENLKNDMEWQQKKAVKEKADWEARMQDGFRWA